MLTWTMRRPSKSRHAPLALCLAFLGTTVVNAQQPASNGTFVLHKFAHAIGSETYSIETKGRSYVLTSHFLFTDRGSKVPLETTFTAKAADMAPLSYRSKGRISRISKVDDSLSFESGRLVVTRTGHSETVSPDAPWFITDGYSPVAMQEQMMRWWLSHGQPAEFTIYPARTKVHIVSAGSQGVVGTPMRGYTVAGLIWGQECLWIDANTNLTALVSTDAEFDHFEAIRQPYESQLGLFIAAAARSNLAALARLTIQANVASAKLLAITGATLEDSTGAPPLPDSVILIQHGIITAAGSRSQVPIPSGATVLDASGKFAIPGLWDMHAHYEQVEWGPIYLAAGVTSVRDVGNEFDFIRILHDELNRRDDPAIGPHLEFAGIIDGSGPISLGAVIADTPEQARSAVEKYQAAGARQIKIYSSVKPEIVKAITAAAHARNMTVTGHVPVDMKVVDAVQDGMDQINHLQYLLRYFTRFVPGSDGKPDLTKHPELDLDGEPAKQLIALLKEHHTVLDPTLAIYEMMSHGVPLNHLEPGVDHLPAELRAALDSPPEQAAEPPQSVFESILKRLHEAGIPIVAGTDQGIPGYSLHRELEIYVDAGFTPLEALQSATILAARAAGVENESGTLQPGKRGDVLLLDADPLADIHNTRHVWRTVAAGAVYAPASLWQSVGFQP